MLAHVFNMKLNKSLSSILIITCCRVKDALDNFLSAQ